MKPLLGAKIVGTPPPLQLELGYDLVCQFRPEAARRDMSVAMLIRSLLDMVAADGLVGAILDTEDDAPERDNTDFTVDQDTRHAPLPERIRVLMGKCGFASASALAEAAGLNIGAVNDIMRGRSKHPRRKTTKALARGLGVPVAHLN
jgi:hypothetical protein